MLCKLLDFNAPWICCSTGYNNAAIALEFEFPLVFFGRPFGSVEPNVGQFVGLFMRARQVRLDGRN